MEKKQIRKMELSRVTGIPYSTLNDICSGKTKLQSCSAELVYKLAQYFGVSVESLLQTYLNQTVPFEVFKSNVCHELKSKGDIEYIRQMLETDVIRQYFDDGLIPMSLYLLALLNYLLRRNNLPKCTAYDDIAEYKLKELLLPPSLEVMCNVAADCNSIKDEYIKNAIPEFLQFNIVEGNIDEIV